MNSSKNHRIPFAGLRFSGKMAFACLLVFALTVFATSFYQFAERATQQANLNALPKADAIVVLTGEDSRIYSAVKLLKAQNGRRLLISGVSKAVSDKTVYETYAAQNAERYCCIDLDRLSLDTKGNARQTADWAALHDFSRLIVVTSSYHMPRSLQHLRNEMPAVDLIPAQIVPADLKGKSTLAMMADPKVLIEYGKLLLTRVHLDPIAKYMWTSIDFRSNG